MSDKLVTVTSFGNVVEAEIARNALGAAGVRAFLEGEATVGNMWHLGNALGGVKLQVAEEDVEKARSVLAGAGDGDAVAVAVQERGWICPTCGSEIEPGFELCWSCGRQFEPGDERQRIVPPPAGPAEALAAAPPAARHDREEPETISATDQLAERAWRAAIIGIFVLPPLLHIYSATLLVRVVASDETLTEHGQRQAFGAALIDAAVFALVAMLLAWRF